MRIDKNKNEQGKTLMTVLLSLVALIFIAIYGMQIGLAFLDKREISSVVEQVIDEVDIGNTSSAGIKHEILKKLSVGSTDIKADAIEVEKMGNNVTIIVNHSKEIPVSENISIHLNLGVEKGN